MTTEVTLQTAASRPFPSRQEQALTEDLNQRHQFVPQYSYCLITSHLHPASSSRTVAHGHSYCVASFPAGRSSLGTRIATVFCQSNCVFGQTDPQSDKFTQSFEMASNKINRM